MKRLRELGNSKDARTARAAAVLSKLEPTAESPARMRRIRRTLDRPVRRYTWRLIRPVAVFGLITGLAATAAAMYGIAQVVQGVVQGLTESPPELSFAPSTQHDTAASKREHAAAPAPDGFELAEPASSGAMYAPPVNSMDSDPPRLVATGAAAAQRSPTSPAANTAPKGKVVTSGVSGEGRRSTSVRPQAHAESEARLVQEGMAALRKHNDPSRAGAYLERYRNEHPDGALAEEALALAIEAASAGGDLRVSELAMQYLSRYPQGRFRNSARQALAKARAADESAADPEHERAPKLHERKDRRGTP